MGLSELKLDTPLLLWPLVTPHHTSGLALPVSSSCLVRWPARALRRGSAQVQAATFGHEHDAAAPARGQPRPAPSGSGERGISSGTATGPATANLSVFITASAAEFGA